MAATIDVAEPIHEACSPSDFEALVATLYEHEGWETRVKPSGPDGGLDIIGERAGQTLGVQCKRYGAGNPVGGPTVREVIGSAQTHGVDQVSIVTTSRFTNSAKAAVVDVNGMSLETVSGEELLEWIGEGDIIVEDGDVRIDGAVRTRDGATGKALDTLERELTGNANSAVGQQLEQELANYIRRRIEEDYRETFLEKQEALRQAFAEAAREKGVEAGERIKESPKAARERVEITWGAARSKREAAVEGVAERKEAAAETVSEKREAASEKADEAKDQAKETASDLKDRFL